MPAMPIQLSHGSEAGEQKKQKVVKEQKPKSKDWSSPLKFFPTCDLLGQPADFFDFFFPFAACETRNRDYYALNDPTVLPTMTLILSFTPS